MSCGDPPRLGLTLDVAQSELAGLDIWDESSDPVVTGIVPVETRWVVDKRVTVRGRPRGSVGETSDS